MAWAETESWRARQILIVDDCATSRTLIQQLLAGLPVRTSFAASAAACRELLAEQAVDLVLLDYRLPDGNGFELLHWIRERWPATTVVLVTGQAELDTATEALVEDADGYVDKRHLRQGSGPFREVLERSLLHRERVRAQHELALWKERFHSLITHDLRNPAACASLALRMYQENPRAEVLTTAVRALDRLFSRMDRYLEFTRLDEGFLELQRAPGCLVGLVERQLEELQPLARHKQIRWCWRPELERLPLEMDELALGRALENVLDNAIKYSPTGGRIEVSLRVVEEAAELRVTDQGPGIPSAFQNSLFERFRRLPGQDPDRPGSGLGLLIARGLVEAHGGTIAVESEGEEGAGASFVLRFPLPAHQQRAEALTLSGLSR